MHHYHQPVIGDRLQTNEKLEPNQLELPLEDEPYKSVFEIALPRLPKGF